jgi:hypothetical protein
MGFTIANYSLLGLQNIQNFYVSIKAGYKISKIVSPGLYGYNILFTVYFQASSSSPVITQRIQTFDIQTLPSPADLYVIIYNNIKLTLDPNYGTDQQTLVFFDDNI